MEPTSPDSSAGDVLAQLEALYHERQQLHEQLGVSEPDAIAEMVRSLEEQVNELYRERERLHNALGVSDPDGVVEMVDNLHEQLIELYRDREQDPGQTASDGAPWYRKHGF